ncbi:MAG: serine hydrolase, partial [Pediococcus pentosaceus]|nr:serine hydrolase [Pediococcus pentosaceus]
MKKLYTMLIAFLMMMPSFAPALAAENNESVIEATTSNITAKSAIAVDENTGQILYSKDENTVRPIASMSKIVAAYLIMKSVKEGQMHWNQKVSINKSLEEVSNNSELTNVPLSSNQTYTVRNLLDASLIYSANAAILSLGKAQAGTSEKFVNEMRSTVKKWGIKDAKLYNAAGLLESQVGSEKYPGTSGNIENEMSAKDMAIVISHVLKEFPEILNITKIQKTTFNTGKEELEITNHNE